MNGPRLMCAGCGEQEVGILNPLCPSCAAAMPPMPNQEPTAPVGARDVIFDTLCALQRPDRAEPEPDAADTTDAILAALRAKGLVIVLETGLAAARPAGDRDGDVYHRAVVDVRETLEGIARMTDEERRKVASLQNQAVWIVYSLQEEGLLATPAPGGPGSEADHDQ